MPSTPTNRLNLEVRQELWTFASDLPADVLSPWSAFLSELSQLQPSKVQGIKVKLEDEVVMLVALLELDYDLSKLVKASKEFLVQASSFVIPNLNKTKTLLAVPLLLSDHSPSLTELEPGMQQRAWQIVVEGVNALAMTGKTDFMAFVGVPSEIASQIKVEKPLPFVFASVDPEQFLQGFKRANVLKGRVGSQVLIGHKLIPFNGQVVETVGATLSLV